MKNFFAMIVIGAVALSAFLTCVENASADVILPPRPSQKQKPQPKQKPKPKQKQKSAWTYDTIVRERADSEENLPTDDSAFMGVRQNHDDGVYVEGEKLTFEITSPIDGYLYVLHYNAEGKRSLIVPNKYWSDNKIRANEKVTYPSDKMNFDFVVEGPTFGEEMITVIVSSERVSTDNGQYNEEIETELEEANWEKFVRGLKSVAKTKDLAVRPRDEVDVPIGNASEIANDEAQEQPAMSSDRKVTFVNISYITKAAEAADADE